MALAAATKIFDDPNCQPPPVKPSGKKLAQLRRVRAKAGKDRFRSQRLVGWWLHPFLQFQVFG